jgi:hypothetical protein
MVVHILLKKNPILIDIEIYKLNTYWQQIGRASVHVKSKTMFERLDIKISKPENRGRGCGSLVVQFICSYLKRKGDVTIFGYISGTDNGGNAKNFWKKNGFSIIDSELEGYDAKITQKLCDN